MARARPEGAGLTAAFVPRTPRKPGGRPARLADTAVLAAAWAATLVLATVAGAFSGEWWGAVLPGVVVVAGWCALRLGSLEVTHAPQEAALPSSPSAIPVAAPVPGPAPAPANAPAPALSLEHLVSRLEHAVFRAGTDGTFVYLSAAWERLTGFAPSETLGQPLVSALHPHDREDTGAAIALVASGRRDHLAIEARLLTSSGAVTWVELRAHTLADAATGTGGAAGTFTDISRRKRIEEGLRSSRRHLNTLLANVPGMVYRGRHDRRWTMEFVSDGCVDLTGYEPGDIVEGGRIAFGDLIHPDDQEFVWALVDTQLAQAKSFQLSYRIVDAAGETKWVWEQGRGVFSSSGELLALEGFITDVTARRSAEEAARRKLWFDARTGLSSRAIFDDRLAYVLDHARAVGYRCAVMWADLDNFGEVNARFGRDFGDRVLVQIARRFKVIHGPGVTVSRVGGDDFAVLLADLRLGGATEAVPAGRSFELAAIRLAERLLRTLAEPLRLDGRELHVTASVGIAISREKHVSAEALLNDARRAATDARAAGAGQWRMPDD